MDIVALIRELPLPSSGIVPRRRVAVDKITDRWRDSRGEASICDPVSAQMDPQTPHPDVTKEMKKRVSTIERKKLGGDNIYKK